MQSLLKYRHRAAILIATAAASLMLVGCLNDLTPQGRWSSPVTDGDYIYVGNSDGVLVRVDASTNSYDVNWLYPYQQDGSGKNPRSVGAIYGSPTVTDDAVYSGGYTCRGSICEAEVFAVSPDTGNIAWSSGSSYNIETKIVGQIQPTENGLVLFGTSSVSGERDPPGYLYAMNRALDTTRRVAWRVPLDGEAWGDAAIDNISNTAYIGTDAGTLYAVDIHSAPQYDTTPEARIKWTYQSRGAITGSVLFHDGKIYFGDLSGTFYRLDPASGEPDWIFDAGNWIWSKAVADSETSTIYVGTLGGDIHALNIENASVIWSQKIEGQIVGSPLLFERERSTFNQRVLAVPSGADSVHIILASDGQNLGVLATNSAVKSSPALINNLIYVHTLDGDLMWFSPDDQTLQGCMALNNGGRC